MKSSMSALSATTSFSSSCRTRVRSPSVGSSRLAARRVPEPKRRQGQEHSRSIQVIRAASVTRRAASGWRSASMVAAHARSSRRQRQRAPDYLVLARTGAGVRREACQQRRSSWILADKTREALGRGAFKHESTRMRRNGLAPVTSGTGSAPNRRASRRGRPESAHGMRVL
jgi:hypothetical protein